jgi:predicted amidohydrolase
MKIGFMQLAPVLGDRDATIEKIDRLIPAAADADILVLPELCNSGYNFLSKEQAQESSEETGKSPFVDYLLSLCSRHNLYIVSGLNEREGDFLYNSSVLVGPEGIMGKYRKMHLFMDEPDYFQPGNLGLPVFDVGICKLGMLICFDWIFPEAWRILAMKGADLICHPSNLVLPGFCQGALPAHAIMNRVYIVLANRMGTEGDLTFTGLSTIIGPKGEVLASVSATEESVALAEMDVAAARDKMMTPRNHVFGDRRPEEYGLLVERI